MHHIYNFGLLIPRPFVKAVYRMLEMGTSKQSTFFISSVFCIVIWTTVK